jgi:hypothetical protein
MIGNDPKDLPDDLRAFAQHFRSGCECKCDLSVGFVCEACVLCGLMFDAAMEIEKLRGTVAEKRKPDREHVATLPAAYRTSMTYVGRNIYTIEGIKGLYWLYKRVQDKDLPKVSARRQSTRGCSWAESVFVRGTELEELLKPVLCE